MKICKEPFENIEITHNGDAFFCCAHDVAGQFIGNIYEQNFEEIWNSEKSALIRGKILNNDYSCCDQRYCYKLANKEKFFEEKSSDDTEYLKKYPKTVKLMHDRECNTNCIICRKNIYRNTNEENKKYKNLLKKVFIPVLKDAEKVVPNAIGDPFASRHSRELIKAVAKKYPKIKFEILTNGILATPKIIRNLGIEKRMDTVFVSFHAASKETYDKIVPSGNFNAVLENIKYLSDLRQNKYLMHLQFNFVVNKYNYKEMVDFIYLAREHNAIPSFWEIRDYNEDVHEIYEDLAVHLPSHPEHGKLLEVLSNEIFDTLEEHELFPVLANLRKKYNKNL